MGNVHARHYQKMPDVQVFAFDANDVALKNFADKWAVQTCSSFEETLGTCDAIDLCVPTFLHEELALKVIGAGRALLLEKPAALTYDVAKRIAEAADKANVTLMVAHVLRYFADYARVHALVKEGAVGRVATVRMRRGGGVPAGREWFLDHSKSGGVLVDVMVHEFDWLRWTVGEVTLVDARSRSASNPNGPDFALATLSFDNQAIAHVEGTWMDPSGFRSTLEISGSEGLLQIDSRTCATIVTHKSGTTTYEAPMGGQDDPYYLQLLDFVAAVKGEKAPAVTGWDGAAAVQIAEAAQQSAKNQEAVAITFH